VADQVYDGFVSYSHAADGLLAPRLQAGLQRFAKPWWRRRALRIFRDESSLSANPHLWSSITEALDSSGWFVLLLSPDAASSVWVDQEIAYWKTHRDPSRILPVVTDGEFGWSGDDVTGDAVPEELMGVFEAEPRWVDLRWARDEEQLDLSNPSFFAAVADIASAIRGIPKDELESEEVRQYRKTVRTAWSAGIALAVLSVVAVAASVQSARNADEAERAEAQAVAQAQLARSRELATESIGLVERDPELATLLALYAWDNAPPGARQPAALSNALWTAVQSNRLVDVIRMSDGGPTFVAVSDDGSRVFVSTEFGYGVRMFDDELNLLWDYTEETTDSFTMVSIAPDGSLAAVGVPDASSAIPQRAQDDLGDDGIPNRVIVFDGETGSVVSVLEYPDCVGVEATAFSPDGRYLAINSGLEGCQREDSRFWVEVVDTASWEQAAFIDLPTVNFGTPIPEFAPDGRLFLFDRNGALAIFAPETFEPMDVSEVIGKGDIIGDGSRVVVAGSLIDASVVDVATGTILDRLIRTGTFIADPLGIEVSPDGRWASVGTFGTFTSVFDLSTGELIHRFATGPLQAHAFDPVGERLYTSHAEGTVKVWDLGTSVAGVESAGDLGTADWVVSNSFSVETLSAPWWPLTRQLTSGLFASSTLSRANYAMGQC
jgi:WD40 repeat protein